MDNYNPRSVCPKCEFEHLITKHITPMGDVTLEYLERKCLNCGYTFHQKTLDSKYRNTVTVPDMQQNTKETNPEKTR